ncbi:MAG: hypothetical protein HZC16_03040, partial [Candidatus Omnitrophica bacterium]|nr:hypothetical protein [Candidatus Omnitrophota bacterium]
MARIIGLDIDEGYIAATQLAKRFKQVALEKSAVFSDLKEIQNQPWLKGARVMINLPAQVVLLRTFHMSPALKTRYRQKDIKSFLERQNLPLKLEECFWDTFALNSNLNLVAARKEMVERYVAQVEQEGLHCQGVTVSSAAIYNVFIYNYPEKIKERIAILNIKSAASDLVIYDTRRIWVYPLAIGKKDIFTSPDSLSRFSTEVQRTFNAHYLQNP